MQYKVPLRHVVDLRTRGCDKLNRESTSVPIYITLCEFHLCCAAAAAVAAAAAAAVGNVERSRSKKNQKKCGL